MKMLFAVPLAPPYSRVGAWLATLGYAKHMQKRGHEVTVVTLSANHPPYHFDGLRILPASRSKMPLYADADVILSHLGDNNRPARHAADLGTPFVRFVHGIHGQEQARLVRHGHPALVVYPSAATRDEVGHSGPSIVVHPVTDLDAYRVEPAGTEVTLVNMAPEKGGHLFWKLADALPHLPFLGVWGGYGSQVIRTRRNVATLMPVSDARRIYRRTRILLMPSITETYGRVGIEAAVSGIPIIAHPSPGLREALGDAPMWLNRADLDAWVDGIRTLAMPSVLRAARERSRAVAEALDPHAELESLAEAIEAL